jgi:hypothetical protein
MAAPQKMAARAESVPAPIDLAFSSGVEALMQFSSVETLLATSPIARPLCQLWWSQHRWLTRSPITDRLIGGTPLPACDRESAQTGPTILIEAGQSIITELISLNMIDRLELSVTPITGGEDRIDIKGLLAHFPSVSSETEGDTVFYTASRL